MEACTWTNQFPLGHFRFSGISKFRNLVYFTKSGNEGVRMSHKKCIIILSEKSSGSSALQNLLVKFAEIQHVSKTRHFENETLYWTKAASILDKPQLVMVDSEVPIERKKARGELISLLKDNLNDYVPPVDDKELIIEGWRLLCNKYSPIFLEKSPHHLCQWAAIELIIECIRQVTDVDFLLIGLIRNPMDTLYSQFKRWGSRPEEVQETMAYRLSEFAKTKGNNWRTTSCCLL